MCLLCVMEPNNTPTREQLLNATDNNPDGFGYAFHCGDRIITGRGMDAEEVVDRFLRIRQGLPNTWAMFHARYTTHGETNKSNCHPFRVGGSQDTVIAHNGVIPIPVAKGDKRSDTRVFADEWLPELLTLLDDEKGFRELEDLIGASKVAVFTIDDRLENQVYILGEDLGHWKGGIWWSNSTYQYNWYDAYKASNAKKTTTNYAWNDSWAEAVYADNEYPSMAQDLEQCHFCKSFYGEDTYQLGYCAMCKTCLECADDIEDCLCYNPSKDRDVQAYRNGLELWNAEFLSKPTGGCPF